MTIHLTTLLDGSVETVISGSHRWKCFRSPLAVTPSQSSARFVVDIRGNTSLAGLLTGRRDGLQTFKFAKDLSKYMNLQLAVLVGGDSMEMQFDQLAA